MRDLIVGYTVLPAVLIAGAIIGGGDDWDDRFR